MKALVLVRHAHRDTSHRELDNGLSERGKKQRKRLSRYFFNHHANRKPLLISSPSKRCVQTLALIARKSKTSLHIDKGLVEQKESENAEQFKKRVRNYLADAVMKDAELIVLCSHGDWIPVAVSLLIGIEVSLSKGGWVEFDIHGNEIRLKNLIQRPV